MPVLLDGNDYCILQMSWMMIKILELRLLVFFGVSLAINGCSILFKIANFEYNINAVKTIKARGNVWGPSKECKFQGFNITMFIKKGKGENNAS